MMRWRHAVGMARYFGARWVAWRVGYALSRATGWQKRRFPVLTDEAPTLGEVLAPDAALSADELVERLSAARGRFFFPVGELPSLAAFDLRADANGATCRIADDFAAGRFLYYNHHVHDLGQPVNWLLNPFSGRRVAATEHWCDFPLNDPQVGEVKDLWEPSRFACAYWWVRAFARTGDDRYAAAFWSAFESWCAQNPYNLGPNWACGQEAALRAMAWCFALFAFLEAPSTTSQRVARLVVMLALHARRIEGNLDYALAQRNNHALSEATGLFTLGLILPELDRARHWEQRGRRVLERVMQQQIYPDGSYIQHSLNYHRLMLQICTWANRLATLHGRPLAAAATSRYAEAVHFLVAMLDPVSGRVPNHGRNDGALVLPLSACDDADFRPTVQAAHYAVTRRRLLPPGPWDEPLVWLFGPEALDAPEGVATPSGDEDAGKRAAASVVWSSPTTRAGQRFDDGGYYTLQAKRSWCMIRCHTYRDRPGHVDMLHVDLWHDGVNVLRDSGTFRYYWPHQPAFEHYFKDIAAHNTIAIDGRGPLELASRWIWLPWPRAQALAHDESHWRGQHFAYARRPWRVTHRRCVEHRGRDRWAITDDLLGHGTHQVTLRWQIGGAIRQLPGLRHACQILANGCSLRLRIAAPPVMTLSLRCGDEHHGVPAGWYAPHYGQRVPMPTVELDGTLTLPVRLRTFIIPTVRDSGRAGRSASGWVGER